MPCPSEDLPLLATGRLTGLPRWLTQHHVKTCAACQKELNALRHLSDSLRTATQANPSADLDERVLSIRPGALENAHSQAQNRSLGGTLMRHPLLLGPLLSISCAAAVTFLQAPTYTASGRVIVVSPNNADSIAAVPTCIELMKASDIREQALLHLEKPLPTFTFEAITHTPIIQVTAQGENPEKVTQGVNNLLMAIQEKMEVQRIMQKRTNHQPDFAGDIRVINEATVPTAPSTPSRTLTLAVGLLAGVFLGGLLTVFRRPGG